MIGSVGYRWRGRMAEGMAAGYEGQRSSEQAGRESDAADCQMRSQQQWW